MSKKKVPIIESDEVSIQPGALFKKAGPKSGGRPTWIAHRKVLIIGPYNGYRFSLGSTGVLVQDQEHHIHTTTIRKLKKWLRSHGWRPSKCKGV